MNIEQVEFTLKKYSRGFHLITQDIEEQLNITAYTYGNLHLFLKHTSASLFVNENCDRDVREDFESFFNDMVCENKPYFLHTYEGSDDMPAHLKSSLLGVDLNIPICNGKLNLGTWQGIYFGEHRNFSEPRTIVATIIGQLS
jgi:secondary thiamine-phosphate synthase enzyme